MLNYTAATIEGRLTRDPEIKMTKTGKKVCTFSLAINHYSSPDAEAKVSYMDVEAWEKTAEICQENLKKGNPVIIIGTLRQDRWEAKDGTSRSKIKLVAKQIRFIESHKKNEKTA